LPAALAPTYMDTPYYVPRSSRRGARLGLWSRWSSAEIDLEQPWGHSSTESHTRKFSKLLVVGRLMYGVDEIGIVSCFDLSTEKSIECARGAFVDAFCDSSYYQAEPDTDATCVYMLNTETGKLYCFDVSIVDKASPTLVSMDDVECNTCTNCDRVLFWQGAPIAIWNCQERASSIKATKLMRYDVRMHKWTDLPTPKEDREDITWCALGSSLYAIGGNKPTMATRGYRLHVQNVERLDFCAIAWTPLANMWEARACCAVAVVDAN